MKKDDKIEKSFEEYFAGNGTPRCDLSAAKRALAEEKAKRSRRRKTLVSVLSACASLLVIASLCVAFFPGTFGGAVGDLDQSGQAPGDVDSSYSPAPGNSDLIFDLGDDAAVRIYSLSAASTRSATYAELSSAHGELFRDFAPFGFAENASCDYTVYSLEGKDVLVCAKIGCIDGLNRFEAEVYTDLTGGAYFAEEFDDYRFYGDAGDYLIETEFTNGEYVSQIYWYASADRFAEVTSPNERGAAAFMGYFLK